MANDVDELLQAQMFGLPPRTRIIAGLVACAGGVAWFVLRWDDGFYSGLGLFAGLLGVAVFWNGRSDLLRQRRIDAEVARANAEWADLRRDLLFAKRSGGNAARLLQDRGYREFAVRRWISRKLAEETNTG